MTATKPTQLRIRFDLEKLNGPTVMSAFQATIGGRFAPLATLVDEDGDLKYFGAIISNEGSKLAILSRTTAALSRLKIIWDKNISLASMVKLMRTLILSTFLYAYESWTLTAEIERRIQALEMRCYRRLLNISYKDHLTNEEVRNRIKNATGVHEDLLTMVKKRLTQMVWPHLKILWHGEDNSARDGERSMERKTEEMGR